MFNDLFAGKKTIEDFGKHMKQELGFALDFDFLNRIKKIYDSDKIALTMFNLIDLYGGKASGGNIIISVLFDQNGSISILWKEKKEDFVLRQPIKYNSDICCDDVLFITDLRKWEQIKGLTLAQYYHQQLEMFDFVLPADEAKAER